MDASGSAAAWVQALECSLCSQLTQAYAAVSVPLWINNMVDATNTTDALPDGSSFEEGLVVYMSPGSTFEAPVDGFGISFPPTLDAATYLPTAAGQAGWVAGSEPLLSAASLHTAACSL